MVKIFGFSILALSLFGCIKPLKPNTAELTGSTTASLKAPNCAGCHAYPLSDINHQFHLYSSNVRGQFTAVPYPFQRPSKVIVCMDCHFGSIASHAYNFPDTTWAGDLHHAEEAVNGEAIEGIAYDKPGYLPLLSSMKIQSLNDPARANAYNDSLQKLLGDANHIGGMLEWMTGRKHMNKRVDVEFAPDLLTDPALVDSSYNPIDISCSNIQCHSTPELKYRWASKLKGFSALPGPH